MTKQLSRRDFLKLSGLGVATSAVLSGCGTAARYVQRKPYTDMPEYVLPGQSVYFATTCRECAAGCGLVVRTVEGRAIKIEGNPNHPVSRGKTCARGQAAIQGLYDPDRLRAPIQRTGSGDSDFSPLEWDAAISKIAETFKTAAPSEIAFLFGLAPDHLFDLAQELTAVLGAPAPLRYGALALFEGRATLAAAADKLYGVSQLPHFDIERAEVTFSFGANFVETWASPVAYTRGYGTMRQGYPGQRGYLVQFEPRMSQTGANADEWLPVAPGGYALVARALGALVAAELGKPVPPIFQNVDFTAAAEASGKPLKELQRLARVFARAERKVAIPGGGLMAFSDAFEAAQAVLALNLLVENLEKPGGIFFLPKAKVNSLAKHADSFADLQDLVKRMKDGKVKALFVHGLNPVFELPASLGFADALKNVPMVVSFSSFDDETSRLAKLCLPDHTPLESWGYQKIEMGADRETLSAFQPVVVPVFDTRATADVLLAAAAQAGFTQLPTDEVAFLQAQVKTLMLQGGAFTAPDLPTFWAYWLQFGGWWKPQAGMETGAARGQMPTSFNQNPPEFQGEEFGEHAVYLWAYPAPNWGDGSGANRSWLQETPDPMTTGMWNTWVELHPETAHELGVADDDVVTIKSPFGEIQAIVYLYPAVRPGVAAIPFGQGHTALGRHAKGRGANPAQLFGDVRNAFGDLAFGALKVEIKPTGKRHQLARAEDRVGVYGDGEH